MNIQKKRWSVSAIIVFSVLVIWGVTQILPLLWLFSSSLKSAQEIVKDPLGLPNPMRWSNYAVAWTGRSTNVSISRYFCNSFVVVGFSLVALVFMATLSAYAFARFRFRGKRALFIYFICLIAVPAHTLVIPLYKTMKDLNLINNPMALILIYSSGVSFSILILQSFFLTIPAAIEEAATVDGAGRFRTFWSIIMPISRGAVAAITITGFIGLWSELLYSMIILWGDTARTLPVGILSYNVQMGMTEYGYQYAALSISTIPMILFYLVFKESILKGMTLGSVK